MNKKEYNPKELIKNINPTKEEKIAIEIDGLDFGIIKKREEFQKGDEEYEELDNENNKDMDDNNNKNKKGNNKKDDDSDNDSDDKEEIELQDIDLKKEEEKEKENEKEKEGEKDEKSQNLLSNNLNQEKNGKNIITLEIKDPKKSEENIPEIETIELLKDIKLTIEKGDLIGIVGPIGAGKTCLLNAILNNLDVLNNESQKK